MKTLIAPIIAFCLLALASGASGQRLTSLGSAPDWSGLDAYQETITAREFQRLLDEIYAPDDAYADWIQVFPGHARIQTVHGDTSSVYKLKFAWKDAEDKTIDRYWRPRSDLEPAGGAKPLDGLRVALDPGHLGGQWAQMEERFFQIGEAPPIREGDLVLIVAQLLEEELTGLGAEVQLVRAGPGPTTLETPQTLRPRAEQLLAESSMQLPLGIDPETNEAAEAVQKLSELLFYRVSEIRARAEKINHEIRPDVVLALHFNAARWTDDEKQILSGENHMHVLVNGAYSEIELSRDDVRYEMLHKLLSRTAGEEIALAEAVADNLARATGLPPYVYPGTNARRVGENPYVWARNLLANRLYQCPVIYLEPYAANNREVFVRLQAGDYKGARTVAGAERISIFREYASGVVAGLLAYYRANCTSP